LKSSSKHLVIYHTSDIHARLGFARLLAEVVEPDALLVDSGDALAGSSVLYRSNEPVISELARAPYAAMAVGNREFHYLHSAFLARSRSLRAPLVCSNVLDLRRREPPFVRQLTVRAGEQEVRILALLLPQYRTGSGWETVFGWRFLAPDVALEEFLASESARETPTILLSHLGLPADRETAKRWPGLAAILGGHTHDALRQPEIVNGIPIAHPGAFAAHVGRLELSFEAGKPKVDSYQLLPLRKPTR
jgi:2',3'-cyclic-nucleotide 2'-phosphodiesterase (5'-nucleotidase family)